MTADKYRSKWSEISWGGPERVKMRDRTASPATNVVTKGDIYSNLYGRREKIENIAKPGLGDYDSIIYKPLIYRMVTCVLSFYPGRLAGDQKQFAESCNYFMHNILFGNYLYRIKGQWIFERRKDTNLFNKSL